MISAEHMQELVDKFDSGEFDIRDIIEHAYFGGREDAEDERAKLLAFICKKYNIPLVDMNCTVDEWEQLKEQKNASKF